MLGPASRTACNRQCGETFEDGHRMTTLTSTWTSDTQGLLGLLFSCYAVLHVPSPGCCAHGNQDILLALAAMTYKRAGVIHIALLQNGTPTPLRYFCNAESRGFWPPCGPPAIADNPTYQPEPVEGCVPLHMVSEYMLRQGEAC